MTDNFGDKYKAENSLGMNIAQPFHPRPMKQQPTLDAFKLPVRKGLGNDMGVIPNAVNGSRMEYCSNAKADSQNKLKGNDQTDGHYR